MINPESNSGFFVLAMFRVVYGMMRRMMVYGMMVMMMHRFVNRMMRRGLVMVLRHRPAGHTDKYQYN